MLLSIAGTFIGVRKYREEGLNGSISYGNALGDCVYLITVASFLYGIYIYWLYRHTPELQENYISTINSVLEEVSEKIYVVYLEYLIKYLWVSYSPCF